uniref:Uncharacterized protein n=1 Tax=Timema cristinae TaxID=61476 RepID=A0A7R9DGU1_TIMCR|nr:unnamed protein product [Timema cristinae]
MVCRGTLVYCNDAMAVNLVCRAATPPKCHASLFNKNKLMPQNCEVDGRAVVHTIHHVDHFSRKLRRRLTQRTLLEAKALKQQSEDLLHTLIQLAELLARDPKAVKEKAMALWVELSKNEPENQARPTTLEQLLVMLTRESARRVVHLANHVSANVAKLPHYLTVAVHEVVDYTTMFTDMLLRTWQLDKTRDQVIVHARLQMLKLQWLASEINTYANQLLLILSVNINNKHVLRQSNNANSTQNNLNAVD